MILLVDGVFVAITGADGGKQLKFNEFQLPFIKVDKTPLPSIRQSVQNTISPSAGLGIAFISARVILGGRNPLLFDFTSSNAELFGLLPSTFMATCEKSNEPLINRSKVNKLIFFMLQQFCMFIFVQYFHRTINCVHTVLRTRRYYHRLLN